MKILNLIINQKYFDEILNGTKTQEFREVKPTTIKKLLMLDENGYELEDEHRNAIPIKYDAIRFFVGYKKDRDSMLVEVKDAYSEIFTETLTDEEGNPIEFKVDEEGEVRFFAVDENGTFLKDENGNYIEDSENGYPIPCDEGESGSTYDEPIEYEHNGQLWVAEQVVYNLGKILEKDVKSK